MTRIGNEVFYKILGVLLCPLYLREYAWIAHAGLIICFYKRTAAMLPDLLAKFDSVGIPAARYNELDDVWKDPQVSSCRAIQVECV